MNKKRLIAGIAVAALFFPREVMAQSGDMTVQAGKIVAAVQPTMWGVFFEDINLGADGGIYAELVKNRSFEFRRPLMGWEVQQNPAREGSVLVLNRQEQQAANPRFVRIDKQTEQEKLGLTNEGFRGMGIKKGLPYDFSVMYRQPAAGLSIRVELVSTAGKTIGTASAPLKTGSNWQKAEVSFTSTDTAWRGKLNIWFEGKGSIDLDMISLFPTDTWKGRKGGMRADMIQLLADMKPGFIRFPGGCIVEGDDLSVRYQWKKTIGPVENRQLIVNRWNSEFAHRPTPDYYQTFGLGFFEYFQLAEDIGAAPLPILNCGMACQFNTAEVVPLDQLDPYIQDALDLIEFANGDTSGKWGSVRAKMGHPAPFNLKMMGVGNENWGPQYIERLALFQQAIKSKYPDFKLVASAGTNPDGDRFNYLDTALRRMKVDYIDEHYYSKPSWFLDNAGRYDNYDRNGAKIFAGEYAAQSDRVVSVNNRNNLRTAISEAAFMTGLERNAGVVEMASYAPLFAHTDGWQWTPDLIWVNNLQSYGTPDYYVQKMFSVNKGTHVVPMLMNGNAVKGQDSLYASAVLDKGQKLLILKVVNAGSKPVKKSINIDGVKLRASAVSVATLQGQSLKDENSFSTPAAVAPVAFSVKLKAKKLEAVLPPNSFTVYKINVE